MCKKEILVIYDPQHEVLVCHEGFDPLLITILSEHITSNGGLEIYRKLKLKSLVIDDLLNTDVICIIAEQLSERVIRRKLNQIARDYHIKLCIISFFSGQ